MLGYSCSLHPFFQHHFHSCRCDCQVVEDVVYAFFSFRHPLLCFFRQGDGYSVLGLDLDMVNVFRLAVCCLVDFTPVQCFHVAISQTCETGEQKGFLYQFVTAWCVLTFFISSIVRNSRSATRFCGFSFASNSKNGFCSIIPSLTAFANDEPK